MQLTVALKRLFPSPSPDTTAWRIYHDARQAEVTHCRFDAHRVRLFAPNTPARLIAQYRRRMNSFANKWLEHLVQAGYGVSDWRLLGPVPEWDRRLVLAPGADDEAEERSPIRRGPSRRTANST